MSIQWFPGHMHKARKEVAKTLPLVDIVFEVLDARIPYSSQNPMINEIIEGKQRLKILTKSDLADEQKTADWIAYFKSQANTDAIALTTQVPAQFSKLLSMATSRLNRDTQADKKIHIMVMGIPNVGKSTLINTLAGKKIAKTGNEPAITKGQQRIKLDHQYVLIDTPGMMWPKVESEKSAYRLATTGAIKDTAISHLDVAFFAVDFMQKQYPTSLQQRYELDVIPANEIECLEAIGTVRGCLGGGGRVDLNRTATVFLNDLRQGSLGRLTLEVPEMIATEEAEVGEAIALKEKRDKERKEQRKQSAKKRNRKK